MSSAQNDQSSITGTKHFQKQFEKASLEDLDKMMRTHEFVMGKSRISDSVIYNIHYTLLKVDINNSIDFKIFYSENGDEQLYVLTARNDDYDALDYVLTALKKDVMPKDVKDNNYSSSMRHDYFSYVDGGIHRNYLIKWCCY
tara:strand:- start:69 stop:494 length:426 start_codon:yes stop_codon:yes gene_type:complete